MKVLFQFSILLISTLTMVLMVACDPIEKPLDNPTMSDAYAYVLNEGLWGGNDAEISRLDIVNGTIVNSYFSQKNGRGLGDLGQDLLIYGGKMYCAVYTSNTVEVIDPISGTSLQQINMGSRGPRYLAAADGKVYVTCYDKSVARIDTANLSVEASCSLSGMQPEGICSLDGKLYVCNGWQQTSSGDFQYDHTISVIDIASFTEQRTIEVGYNPYKIKALDNGMLALCCWGDYGSHRPCMMLVDATTGQTTDLGVEASNFDVKNNDIYLYSYSRATGKSQFYMIDAVSHSRTEIMANSNVTIVSPSGINVNPTNGDIYITDSRNYQSGGDVHCFASDGTHRFCVASTVGPSKVVF